MIHCNNVRFAYPGDPFSLSVDEFAIESGEKIAFVGPSGCGKTTLLNLIAGILIPESGSVEVASKEISAMSFSERQRFRRDTIGLIPQNFELLDYLTLRENLLVPCWMGENSVKDRSVIASRAEELAERAGIVDLLAKYPSRVSQGERQRAALCRGLVLEPSLILADEPTGNLDPENQEKIVSLLLEEADTIGASVIMITHEPSLQPRFDRVVNVLELRGKEAAG